MHAFFDSIRTSAAALRGNTGLRRLSLTAAIAELSAPVYYTAALVWAFGTGGAMLAAIYGIVAMLPAAFVAPFLAVVTDRSRKELVVVVSLVARGALLVVLTIGVAFECTLLVLAAATAASICARTLYPALAALLPSLARSRDELVTANALVGAIENVGLVVGPALAGIALVTISPAAVCLSAAVGTLAAAAAATRIRVAGIRNGGLDAEDGAGSSPARELAAGFAVIGAARGTRSIVAVHAVHWLGLGALAVVVVQLALEDLRLGSPGVGMLEASLAVGGLVGGVVVVGVAARHDCRAAIRRGALLWAVALVGIAALTSPTVAFAGLAVLGLGNVLLDVSTYTHVQESTPEDVLARTIAALQSIAVGAVGIGNLAAGLALEALGTQPTLVLLALGPPVAAAVLLRPTGSPNEQQSAFSPATAESTSI